MTSLLYRLGRASALHPWRVIGLWLAAAALVIVSSITVGRELADLEQLVAAVASLPKVVAATRRSLDPRRWPSSTCSTRCCPSWPPTISIG